MYPNWVLAQLLTNNFEKMLNNMYYLSELKIVLKSQ